MASRALELILFSVAAATAVLGTATVIITLRFRREIYRAEKRRATEILLRTRTTHDSEPNLVEDKHAYAGRQ